MIFPNKKTRSAAADNGFYGKSRVENWDFYLTNQEFDVKCSLQIFNEPGPSKRWICEFQRRNGVRKAIAPNRKRYGSGQIRILNLLDGVFSACESVGFRAVTVVVQ
jgi:hypothetical protein